MAHRNQHRRLRTYAREMRKNPTAAEANLWSRLREKRLMGRRFRRQHVLAPFIVDFYCHAEKIVVEVDGKTHQHRRQEARDRRRTAYLCEEYGVELLRFPDLLVLNDVEFVLRRIWESFS